MTRGAGSNERKNLKKRSLSYRVSTPEERARRQSEIEKRSERIMVLKGAGPELQHHRSPYGLEFEFRKPDRAGARPAIGGLNPIDACDQGKESKVSSHSQRLSCLYDHGFTHAEVEVLTRELFERASRDDTFDDLKRRSAFNRQDAGRLRHWNRVAQSLLLEGTEARPVRP